MSCRSQDTGGRSAGGQDRAPAASALRRRSVPHSAPQGGRRRSQRAVRAPARTAELPSRSAELLDVNPAPLIDKDLFPLRPACQADDEPDKQPQAAGKETEDAMDDVVDRLPPKQGCLISALTFETDAFKARVQNRLVDLMLEKTPTLLVGHSRALRSRKVSTRH